MSFLFSEKGERMKGYLLKKLLFDLVTKKESRENLLLIILVPILAFVLINWAGMAWIKTDMHLVTPEERKEAAKKGLPPPKSYWIIEKEGRTYHLDFENEALAEKHYEFQQDMSLFRFLLKYGVDIENNLEHQNVDVVSGAYSWDSSKSSLPAYVPQQSLFTHNAGLSGQCTWYAADRVLQLYKIRLPALGNGGDWARNAKARGYKVDKNAKVGDAVCFPQGSNVKNVDPRYGHIAILEKINSDGSIVCTEFWGGVVDYKLHWMTYSAYEASQAYYIHFGG